MSSGGSTYQSQGNGTFLTGSFAVQTVGVIYETVLRDVDQDGYLDILRSGPSGIEFSRGNGSGTFSSYSTATIATAGAAAQITTADFNSDGALDIALGATGYLQTGVSVAVETTTLQRLNLTTSAEALSALGLIDAYFSRVSQQLGDIGASLSRLEVATSVLRQTTENHFSAASRISDVDIAEESARLQRAQITQQVAASVLAQANQQSTIALSLL